jgi:hypothetical protein
MQNSPQQTKGNPLATLMRQPKLYIKLPSKGQYWPKGSLTSAPGDEFPVYSMTAKDEIMLKNPSAMATGQAVVNVIQSCLPNIVNAWDCPNLDMDSILIAIRIATYGPILKIEENEIDLKSVLDQLYNKISWIEQLPLDNGLIMHIKPLPYRAVIKAAGESIETQKIMMVVNDEKLTEDEKLSKFKDSFVKLTNITLSVVADSIFQIDTADGSVTDQKFIDEYMEQCDRDIFNAVKNHLDKLTEQNTINSVTINEVEVPLVFEPNTFFV